MAKSLAQEAFEQKHARETEVAIRELERRSHDTVRVYNPLDKTFTFMYDRYLHRIPARSYKDLDRYLAIHFFKKICDEMIGQQILLKGDELKTLREKQLGHQFLDKYEENTQIWDRVPRLNDPDLIEQIKSVVLVGIVEEYGMEEPDELEREADRPYDTRPLHEQIFSEIDKVQAPPEGAANVIKPIEEILTSTPAKAPIKKNDLAKEVSI